MIMDGLDTLSQVALASDQMNLSFDTYHPPSQALSTTGSMGRQLFESVEDTLNTPVTTNSETTFFGADTFGPLPITATGKSILFLCNSRCRPVVQTERPWPALSKQLAV